MKKDILVIGYGFVGSATAAIFSNRACNITIYDVKPPYNKIGLNSPNKDFIFICVGTPSKPDGSIDDSAVISNLDKLVSSAYSGIVVIKSTVLYSSIKPYFDKLRIVINPEFLSQNSFMEDAFSQENILLGGNPSNVYKVMQLYNQDTIPEISQNPNLKFRCVTPEEAIQFKYMRNIFGAHLVTFWEWVQDQTGNARLMADLYKDFKLPSDMSQVGMDGYRGFGGACFPKDVAAWNHENNDALTTMLMEYNYGLYCQI